MCPVCCVVCSQQECGSFCMGWACGQMLGCLDWESWVWLWGRGGLVPAERMERGLPHLCQSRRLHDCAAQSLALGEGVRNAGKKGQWDCWGVPTNLCVDGGHWGGRLHLERKIKENTNANDFWNTNTESSFYMMHQLLLKFTINRCKHCRLKERFECECIQIELKCYWTYWRVNRNITWWRWSTAHGLEVLGSGLTKVCWGRHGVPSRRSTGVLGWRVTVGTHFVPRRFSRFPGRFMKTSFLMTGWPCCYTWTWKIHLINFKGTDGSCCPTLKLGLGAELHKVIPFCLYIIKTCKVLEEQMGTLILSIWQIYHSITGSFTLKLIILKSLDIL